MPSELSTTDDVIDALGGIPAVMELTGSTYKAVFNWKGFSSFPSKTYLVMTDALVALGKTAPASLWGMTASQESEPAQPQVQS
jgi:hypothetical protein